MCFDSVPSLHGGHCGRGVRVGVERQHLGADEVLDEGERSTCAVDSPIELHTAGLGFQLGQILTKNIRKFSTFHKIRISAGESVPDAT